MPKNFIIDVPLYPAEIMVSINQVDSQVIRSINKWPKMSDRNKIRLIDGLEENPEDKSYGILLRLHGTGCMILRIHSEIRTSNDQGTLAHEIFHAVEYIASHCGLKHCDKSSEAFAYLISFLTTEIYKRI